MTYYNDRIKAHKIIKSLLSKGTNKETIYIEIFERFGFSEKIVNKSINIVEDSLPLEVKDDKTPEDI